jgi:flavin-dependent dehydrogenase
MREQVIVGAGLSGMVAAINLAREGYSVTVRERRDRVGGLTDIIGLEGRVINIGDGTPINLERMSAYTGIDISPVAVPLERCMNHLYGRTYEVEFYEGVPAYLVERGPRPTSIDVYLYELARMEGVEFSFSDTVTDFVSLPPDSIIATGLFGEAWKPLGVPHLAVYGYLAMGETDEADPKVVIYFDEYTRDYAFYSQVNSARGACLFSRGKPLDVDVKDRFRKQLAENDGIEFDQWDAVSMGALPVETWRNPRLFAKNYILAGTLSGTMDPFLLFGVHGALVSGKIAAMAVSDHQAALEEFNRVNKYYRQGYLFAWAYQKMPLWFLQHVTWFGIRNYPWLAPLMKERVFKMLPGFARI